MDTDDKTAVITKNTESLSGNLMGLVFLSVLGILVDYIPELIYAVVLWTMSRNCANYGNAGKCGVIAVVCSFATDVIFPDTDGIAILLGFPAAICALVCEYEEYCGHQAVLEDIDPEQSQKWDVLWKWFIGVYGITLLSIFIVFVSAEIASVVAGGCAICLIIISITKIVYLYRTSKILKNITEKSTGVS